MPIKNTKEVNKKIQEKIDNEKLKQAKLVTEFTNSFYEFQKQSVEKYGLQIGTKLTMSADGSALMSVLVPVIVKKENEETKEN